MPVSQPRLRSNPAGSLTHALVIAVLYVSAWLAFFAARVPGPLELALSLVIATSVAAGWAIGRWWAILLPIGVVPILASSLPYTPGGAPEYGVGIFGLRHGVRHVAPFPDSSAGGSSKTLPVLCEKFHDPPRSCRAR